MVAFAQLVNRNEFAAVIIRTDFSDEAAWRQVAEELEESAPDDDPAESYDVVDAPELADADTDTILAAVAAHEELWEQLSVVFVADSKTMRFETRTLLTVTTMTREIMGEQGYEAMTEFGREFRTVPSGLHSIHANLELANMDFEDFSAKAHKDPEGIFRSF
ncbi:DUF6924 domain-containing protein [Streptomyces sp. NPDC090083]|uniref:DUF6924 domain-containing protein n=1 Tax=Streptomyces sp. NPDC090083 TaxID=3365941 RepID=UPI003825F053